MGYALTSWDKGGRAVIGLDMVRLQERVWDLAEADVDLVAGRDFDRCQSL